MRFGAFLQQKSKPRASSPGLVLSGASRDGGGTFAQMCNSSLSKVRFEELSTEDHRVASERLAASSQGESPEPPLRNSQTFFLGRGPECPAEGALPTGLPATSRREARGLS